MTVQVISHDQGVDGGRAIAVFLTQAAAIRYVETVIVPKSRSLQRVSFKCWESLGDTYTIEEFVVQD
jgi:hypothetical protein